MYETYLCPVGFIDPCCTRYIGVVLDKWLFNMHRAEQIAAEGIDMNRKLFGNAKNETELISVKTYFISCTAALLIGFYDGFYGPGTGTFLIICLNVFGRLPVIRVNPYIGKRRLR